MSPPTLPLFDTDPPSDEVLCDGARWLRAFARWDADALLTHVAEIAARAPFRHMVTPGGFTMSAAMTNCGALGWTSDARGYRYADLDPSTGLRWPALPAVFLDVAARAAAQAGYAGFVPDACLVNRYAPGAKMSLHQDKNELDLDAPIVSVSLGLPVVFLFGGDTRRDTPRRIPLSHGDVVVWGGPSRLRYHGVAALKPGHHPLTGQHRINLTLRKAGR